MKLVQNTFLTIVLLLLTACSSGPGPLEGKWRLESDMPLTIEFRTDESESMGIIEKVEYEANGSDVLVRYKEGLSKGTAMRFTVVDKNTLSTELGTLKRIN